MGVCLRDVWAAPEGGGVGGGGGPAAAVPLSLAWVQAWSRRVPWAACEGGAHACWGRQQKWKLPETLKGGLTGLGVWVLGDGTALCPGAGWPSGPQLRD